MSESVNEIISKTLMEELSGEDTSESEDASSEEVINSDETSSDDDSTSDSESDDTSGDEESKESEDDESVDEDKEEEEEESSEEEEFEDEESSKDSEDKLEPPRHWKSGHKESFSKLPKDLQEFLIAREKETTADYTRKTQDIAEIKRAVEPFREHFANEGVTDGQAIANLLGIYSRLLKDPKQTIVELADNFNLTLEEALGDSDDDSNSDRYKRVEKKLADIEKANEQKKHDAAKQQRSAVEKNLQAFFDDPNNKFVEEVWEDMRDIGRIAMSRGADATNPDFLKKIYDKACRMNDGVSEKYLASLKNKSTKDEKNSSATKKKRAIKTAKKGTSVPKSSSSVSKSKEKKSDAPIGDLIAQDLMEELNKKAS